MNNLLEAKIITGNGAGELVTIPKITLKASDDCPIEFTRFQFPVKVSYAMTINKSQGQTLKVAGLYLGDPCFSHGQFYVGCSRVGSSHNLYIRAPGSVTKNVVNPLALN